MEPPFVELYEPTAYSEHPESIPLQQTQEYSAVLDINSLSEETNHMKLANA